MRRLASFALLLALTTPLFAAGFRLVANPSVKESTLTKSTASTIFLKKSVKWEDGSAIIVLDQWDRSPVRAAFSTAVHGRSAAAVKSYWNQQVFSGRDVPPVEKTSDDEVIAFVRKTPGAIGYVSAEADVKGLKSIEIR
jgi:ABC-type phosphate transport system substrate-binding protein